MKELAVEVKMVYLVVAKVVYMEVEMVEKVVVEIGSLEVSWWKRGRRR